MFQAPTPSLGWLVDPSDCWISQHLHCVVTDIKDPTRVVAMVEHVVSFLPLHIGEIFRIKIIQFEMYPTSKCLFEDHKGLTQLTISDKL